jgi:hypothetical protein
MMELMVEELHQLLEVFGLLEVEVVVEEIFQEDMEMEVLVVVEKEVLMVVI